MNLWAGLTDEQKAARIAKSQKTRQTNKAAIAAALASAEAEKAKISIGIIELENRLQELSMTVEFGENLKSVSGRGVVSREKIIAAAKPFDKFVGVYFLIADNQIVYVGQSVNVPSRIMQHYHKFDSYAFIRCEPEILDHMESIYIHLFQPELNGCDRNGCKIAPIGLSELFLSVADRGKGCIE